MNQSEKVAFMAEAVLTREHATVPGGALSGKVIFQMADEAFPEAGVPKSTFLALLSPLVKEGTSPINCEGRKQGYYLTNPAEKPSPNPDASYRSGIAAKWKPRPIPNLDELWENLRNSLGNIPAGGSAEIEVPEYANLLVGLTKDGRRLLILRFQSNDSDFEILEDGVFYRHWADPLSDSFSAGRRMTLEQLPGDDTNRFLQLGKDMLPILARLRVIEPKAFVKAIKKALLAWQRKNTQPLGMAQEMGLIAELWFLENILMKHLPKPQWQCAVGAWHGPRALAKDFWLKSCIFEVKATGPSKSSITISNIDQLDFDKADPPLYLFRISVGKRPAPVGKTLVTYIEELRKKLKAVDSELEKQFNSCLAGKPEADLEVEDPENDDAENKDWESKGYHDQQKGYARHYQVYSDPDQRAFHWVHGNFPRLTPKIVAKHKVAVKKYEIRISDCGKSIDEETEIAPLIKKAGKRRHTA